MFLDHEHIVRTRAMDIRTRYIPYSAKFSRVFNFANFVNLLTIREIISTKFFTRKPCARVSMDNIAAESTWDALQRDTFEVGIALLTAASSSADNGVTVHIR